MANMHVQENWRDKCERYVTRQISSTPNQLPPGETPRSARSIIPPVRNSGKYKVSNRNPKPDDLYIRKAFTLSSIHGLPFVAFLNSRLGRIMWLILIAVGLATLLYFLVNHVQLYLENQRHFEEAVSHANDDPEFPTVTLCNLNPLQKSKISGSNFRLLAQLNNDNSNTPDSTDMEQRKAMILNALTNLHQFMLESGIESPYHYIEENKPWLDIYSEGSFQEFDWISLRGLLEKYDGMDLWGNFLETTREEAQLYGQSTADLLVKCKQGRHTCDESSVESITHPLKGLCTSVQTSDQGLSLVLDGQTEESLGLVSDIEGIEAYIHSPDAPFYTSRPLILQPGHKYAILLERERTERQQPCGDRAQEVCVEGCVDAHAWELCGCYAEPYQPESCRPFDVYQGVCLQTVRKLASEGLLGCRCDPQCSSTKYSLTDVSQSVWPSASHMPHFLREMSIAGKMVEEKYIRSNYIALNVETSPDSVTKKEVLNISLLDLLSNVGGLSCLLVGMSVISVVEFLFLIFFSCWQKCQATNRTGKNRVRQPSAVPVGTPANYAGFQNHSGLLLPPFKSSVMYLPASHPVISPPPAEPLRLSTEHFTARGHQQTTANATRDAPRAKQPAPKRTPSRANGTSKIPPESTPVPTAPPLPPLPRQPSSLPLPPPPHYTDADESASNDMYFEIAESRVIIKETRREDVPPLELWT